MDLFEQATRKKLRFDTYNGLLGVEDLWDLPLTSLNGKRANLDDIAKGLHAELKDQAEASFVLDTKVSDTKALLQLEFDVVIHVINTKISEQKAAALAASNREKKQRIMALIERKQDEALSATSIDELQQMLNGL